MHLKLLLTDAWHTKNFSDKLVIWFKPTGWRPADRAIAAPVDKVEDLNNFIKFKTSSSILLNSWCWTQLLILLLFVSWLFSNIIEIGQPDIYTYGLFVFLFVYALTELMDGNLQAYFWELLKSMLGISLLLYHGNWFGVPFATSLTNGLLLAYFLCAPIMSFLLVRKG